MSEKNINKIILDHYESLLDDELNEGQQNILFAYINGAEIGTTKDLPKCKQNKTFYNRLDNFLEKNKSKNLPPVMRFLHFLYEKEGYEGFAETIADCVEYSYKGIRITDFFDGEFALSPSQKIVYCLYELYSQIHLSDIKKYTQQCASLFQSNPIEFEAIAMKCPAPHVRLRAASVLFANDPAKYGEMINEIVPVFINQEEQGKRFEELFNSACITNFENQVLNEALKAQWPNSLRETTHTMSYNLWFKEDFVNPELFRKDYPPEDNCRCKFDFFQKVASAIGVDDQLLCKTVLYFCGGSSDDDLKYAAEFLTNYPQEMSLQIFQSYSVEDYLYFDTMDKFRRLFAIQKNDRAPIVKAIEGAFDNIMRHQFQQELCSEDSDTGETTSTYCDEVLAYILQGDTKSFEAINHAEASDELYDCLNGRMYGTSEFLGYFAEEPTLKEKIRRYLQVMITARVTYGYARLINAAVKQYNWGGEQIADYCFDGVDMAYEAVLLFFDEMLISDKERKSKDHYGRAVNVITEAVTELLMEPCKQYILAHKQETYDFFNAITDYYDCGVINAYGQLPELDPAPLVQLLTIKQKALRERVVKVMGAFPSAAPLIEKLMSHKRKDVRGYADKAMSALKNLNAFALPGAGAAGIDADADFDPLVYAKENTPKNADKLLASFTDPNKWPAVKYAGKDDTVPVEVLKCYVAIYAGSKEMQRMFSAEKIRSCLDATDMKALSRHVFQDWWSFGEEDQTWNGQTYHFSRGGDTKTKGVMTLLGIHGGDEGVTLLKNAVKSFDNSSRSAMAGDAVRALGISHSTMALVAVDNMARVFRNKLVRRVAGETITAAAESMGITVDEMSDKIVPNLGLDERGEGELDLGTEKLTVKIDNDLKVSLFRADGKLLKKFPENKYTGEENELRGWTYDTELYDLVKSDFNLLKKELKSLVKIQTERLELSLSKARTWDYAGFQELFIQNPIMQRFASSLIFGVYEDGKLISTFRYSGDGTLSDLADEAFTLPETAQIRIAHPIDLTAEQIGGWQEQLSDYEIKQPFAQLSRPVFDNTVCSGNVVDLFNGEVVTGYFIPKMLKYDWFIGGAGDGGGFYCIYYADKHSGYSACLEFEHDYPYMGNLTDCSPSIGVLTFFKTGVVVPSYDFSIDDFNITKPVDVPKQVYSEIVYRVAEGVKACRVKD